MNGISFVSVHKCLNTTWMHLVYTHFKYGNTNYILGSSASCRPAPVSPSTSVTTPLRRDSLMIPVSCSSSGVSSYWPVTRPMAQMLWLCDARRFFVSTFISDHLTSATLWPSEATTWTLSATCCHSRAFLALATRPNPPNNTAFLLSDKNFFTLVEIALLSLSLCFRHAFSHECSLPDR